MLNEDEISDKLKELDSLKKKVEKLLSLSDIGGEIREELEVEVYKKLKQSDVNIEHLDKKFGDEVYKRKQKRSGNPIVLTESEVLEAQEKTSSAIKAAKRLGVSYPTYKKYAKKYNIHKTPGWPIKKGEVRRKGPINPYKGKFPLNEILENKHPNFPAHRLKDKLIRADLKKCECENCGYNERRITDGKIPLLINFDDGNENNFILSNLKLLCYNCTFTCGKGYISRGKRTFDPDMLQGSKKELKQRF